MKKTALALVLALALIAGACGKKQEPAPTEPAAAEPAAPAQPDAGPTAAAEPASPAPGPADGAKSYRYVLEASGGGTPKVRFEYLVVPPRMNVKMFSDMDGRLVETMNLISDGQNYWMVQNEARMAMKMPAEAKPEIPEQMMFAPDWTEFVKAKAEGAGVEELGRAQVNGMDTTKYRIKEISGQAVMTVYVDGKNMVRRIEVQQGEQGTFVMDVIELELNPSVSDANFQPPAGYTIQEIPVMPGVPRP